MDRNYGGVVWTNHALDRLKQRGITQEDAWATFQRPEQSRYAKTQGAWIYYRTYGSEKLEVVAKQNERKEWVILTVWSRPVYERHGHRKSGYANQNIIVRILRKLLNI